MVRFMNLFCMLFNARNNQKPCYTFDMFSDIVAAGVKASTASISDMCVVEEHMTQFLFSGFMRPTKGNILQICQRRWSPRYRR